MDLRVSCCLLEYIGSSSLFGFFSANELPEEPKSASFSLPNFLDHHPRNEKFSIHHEEANKGFFPEN